VRTIPFVSKSVLEMKTHNFYWNTGKQVHTTSSPRNECTFMTETYSHSHNDLIFPCWEDERIYPFCGFCIIVRFTCELAFNKINFLLRNLLLRRKKIVVNKRCNGWRNIQSPSNHSEKMSQFRGCSRWCNIHSQSTSCEMSARDFGDSQDRVASCNLRT
jgi:hypothetical protein